MTRPDQAHTVHNPPVNDKPCASASRTWQRHQAPITTDCGTASCLSVLFAGFAVSVVFYYDVHFVCECESSWASSCSCKCVRVRVRVVVDVANEAAAAQSIDKTLAGALLYSALSRALLSHTILRSRALWVWALSLSVVRSAKQLFSLTNCKQTVKKLSAALRCAALSLSHSLSLAF